LESTQTVEDRCNVMIRISDRLTGFSVGRVLFFVDVTAAGIAGVSVFDL